MPARNTPSPVMDRLAERFSEWLNHRRDLDEIRQMGRETLDSIASDLRISPETLDELVFKGPHAADEVEKLLKVLGVDESDLIRVQPFLLRDMQRVCALCVEKSQCNRDLAAGNSAEHFSDYCLNASTIDDIRQRKRGTVRP